MTKIKFCGITNFEDAEAAMDLEVDALGFNFYPRSSRCLTTADAQTIVRRLPASVGKVGVFVNAPRAEVEETARSVGLSALQFHGDESLDYCRNWGSWEVIKALRIGNPETDTMLREYAAVADYLLFDRYQEAEYGGTGEEVEQVFLEAAFSEVSADRVILAGGLDSDNVEGKVLQYKPYGVDVASGIERSPGKKSILKMSSFVAAVKRAAAVNA